MALQSPDPTADRVWRPGHPDWLAHTRQKTRRDMHVGDTSKTARGITPLGLQFVCATLLANVVIAYGAFMKSAPIMAVSVGLFVFAAHLAKRVSERCSI